MVRRQFFPLLWLVVLTCRAAEPRADSAHVLDVRSGWEYAPTAHPPSVEQPPEAWQAVKLPHRQDAEPCGLYRATFAVPAAWSASRVCLAVRPTGGSAWVWLNGQLLGVRSPSALDIRLDASKAVRAGARNTLVIAIAAPAEQEREGLGACWLEATSAVSIERLAATPWCLAQGAVVDVALDAANGSRERFEGKVELALEAEAGGKQAPRVWRRGNDVRLDAGQGASAAHSFEPDPPRLWRVDDPFLYRLTATLQTREGQAVRTVVRRVGVRSVAASQGRWLVNGEWVRLAGIAITARGATLLCTQPGQASALAERLAGGVSPRRVLRDGDVPPKVARDGDVPPTGLPLDALLDHCDEAGIVAFLDAPACPAETAGWRETLDALTAEALRHPCVWGWVVSGESEAYPATLARLRELTPNLPIGRPKPDAAADAKDFDFILSRFATKPGREDDDAYGKRLDDLARDAGGRAVIAVDRVTETADKGRTDASLAHRCREAERRSQVAALAFGLDSDEALFGLAEKRLSPFRLNPPSHEARLDGQAYVVKSRFEAHLASPVAQRLPCYSLVGCRIAWRASRGDALVASGTVPLTSAQARAIEGGAQPGRGEVEWRADKAGDIEFAVELQSAAGRTLARHSAKLSFQAKDGRAELRVQ